MARLYRRLILLFLCALLPFFVRGATAAQPVPKDGWTHAIAMHGQPKLSENASHFGYADPKAPQGGTIVQSEIGTFDTLNPYTLKGKSITTPDLIVDRLTARSWDEPFTLYGLIAREIWLAPDRKRIVFRLDPKARFNDGTPITSDDVAFTFETLKAKGRPNMRRIYGLVTSVDRYDTRTIGFTLGKHADRETPMILAMMPVLSARDWKGRTFDATTLKPMLTSAPYTITAVDPGRSYTLTKTPDYWARDHMTRRGLYNPQRWIVRYFRDATVALEAFKKGDIGFKLEQDPARWAAQYQGGFIKKEIPMHRPDRVRAIMFNTRRPPLNSLDVRQALRLSFNEDWIITAQGYGALQRTVSLFPNSDLAAERKTAPYDERHNLRRADAILTKAGYPVRGGKRALTLTLILNEARDEKVALAWQASLRKLGIDLVVRTLDTVQFTGALGQFDYDMILNGWANSLSPGSEQSVYWGCEAAKTPGSLNYTGLCDDQVEAALKDLGQADARPALRAAVRTLDRRLYDLAPAIYLPHQSADRLAYWPDQIDPGRQNALYGFVLESLAATR